MNRFRRKPHCGALLICVLVCLLVASSLVTSAAHSALRSRRDIPVQYQMRQTELLLDAGVLRAARRILSSDDYRGELWRPTAALPRFDNALIEIRVTVDDNEPRLVEVIASLGVAVDDAGHNRASRTRRTHTFEIERSEPTSTSDSSSTE